MSPINVTPDSLRGAQHGTCRPRFQARQVFASHRLQSNPVCHLGRHHQQPAFGPQWRNHSGGLKSFISVSHQNANSSGAGCCQIKLAVIIEISSNKGGTPGKFGVWKNSTSLCAVSVGGNKTRQVNKKTDAACNFNEYMGLPLRSPHVLTQYSN